MLKTHSSSQSDSLGKSSTGLVYLLRETVLILVFIYLFLFNGTAMDFIDANILRVTFGLLTVAALAWLVVGQRVGTPAGKALLAFVGVYLLASLFSMDVRRSLEDFGWLLFIVFLFALFADLVAHGWQAELIIKSLLIAWTLVLAFAWVSPILWYMNWLKAFPGQWLPAIVYRPDSPNTLGMALNVLLMLALARWLHSRSWFSRVVMAVMILMIGGMLFLTSSRAGWIGTAAGLACLAILLVTRRRESVLAAWNWLRQRRILMMVSGLALVAALIPVGWLLYRQTLHPSHGPLLDSRRQFWEPAFATIWRYPLLGQGPNTFSASLLTGGTLPPGAIYVHAHSTPLNLLAETGLLGGLAGLCFGVSLVLVLRKRWQSAQGKELPVVLGACAALAAYAVHGLFDAFQAEPIGLWLLAIVLGVGAGKLSDLTWKPKWYARPWWVFVLIGAAWLNLWLLEPMLKGVEAATGTRWQEAAAQFNVAVQRDPQLATAWQQLGLAESVLAAQGDTAALERAATAFEQAAAFDPAWALNQANLAALYRAQGELGAARQTMEAALAIAPDVALFHMNLGRIAEEQGDLDAARREYELALQQDAITGMSAFWAQTPLLQAMQPVTQEAQQHNVSELEAELAANPSQLANYLALAEAYLAEDQVVEAERTLNQAQFAIGVGSTDQNRLMHLQAELAERKGETARAQELRGLIEQNCQLQGLTGPGESTSPYYALAAFRQPAMYLELVPQMIRMPCE